MGIQKNGVCGNLINGLLWIMVLVVKKIEKN